MSCSLELKNGSQIDIVWIIQENMKKQQQYSQCSTTVWRNKSSWKQRIANSADVVLEDLANVETELHLSFSRTSHNSLLLFKLLDLLPREAEVHHTRNCTGMMFARCSFYCTIWFSFVFTFVCLSLLCCVHMIRSGSKYSGWREIRWEKCVKWKVLRQNV